MKKYLPSLLPILVSLSAILAAPVQHYVSAHPSIAVSLGSILAIINHFLPSPSQG